jgi:hypothetical protein
MTYVSKFGICVVCHRIADVPAPKVPSIRQKCAACRAAIWVPKASPIGPPKLCLACAKHFGASTPRRLNQSVGIGISVCVADDPQNPKHDVNVRKFA